MTPRGRNLDAPHSVAAAQAKLRGLPSLLGYSVTGLMSEFGLGRRTAEQIFEIEQRRRA